MAVLVSQRLIAVCALDLNASVRPKTDVHAEIFKCTLDLYYIFILHILDSTPEDLTANLLYFSAYYG